MPSSRPADCRPQATSANRRVCRIHAAPLRPASSAALANANGTANAAKPASTTGGWISMPPSRSTGLSPRPSGGVTERSSKGLATTARTKRKNVMIAGILAAIITFFLFVLAVVASPFELLSVTPPDGLGLNPVLRDGGMLIHPPVVLAGFAAFAVPFAFASAALLAGRSGAAWIRHTRRFALVAWGLQSAGLLLGMWWAYHVLGWGGYWGWDPVENVALMPWLATTAYLHSSQVQERRGRLRGWNLGLVMLAFLLVVFGTFIVRSGVVPSVHTFAISAIGPWFFGFLFVCLVFSIALLALRAERLGTGGSPAAPPVSREGAFVLQNLLLLGV